MRRQLIAALLSWTAAASISVAIGAQPIELIADVGSGSISSYPHSFVEIGSRVYFQTCASNWNTTWKIESPGATPTPLEDSGYYCEPAFQEPQFDLAVAGSRLVYVGSRYDLYAHDGVETVKLGVTGRGLATVGDRVAFFESSDRVLALWSTDGTVEGTRRVTSLCFDAIPEHVAGLGDVVVFDAGASESCDGLWQSDLTAAGTQRLLDSYEIYDVFDYIFARAGDTTFFWVGALYTELWATDGTLAGTRSLGVCSREGRACFRSSITTFEGEAFFSALDLATQSFQIWRTDGTPDRTSLVYTFPPTFRRPLIAADAALYFLGLDGERFPSRATLEPSGSSTKTTSSSWSRSWTGVRSTDTSGSSSDRSRTWDSTSR